MPAGLPNITGTIESHIGNIMGYLFNSNYGTRGAFYGEEAVYDTKGSTQGDNMNRVKRVHFDASRSSNIYGNSTTVQPPSIQLIPQIKY